MIPSQATSKMIIVYKLENVNVLTQISNNKGSVYRDVEDVRIQLGFLCWVAFFYGGDSDVAVVDGHVLKFKTIFQVLFF